MEDEELSKLRAEAEELRRQREEIAYKLARKTEVERARFEVAREQRRLRDEPEIAKAVDEHGPLGIKTSVIEAPDGSSIVIKRPSHLHWKRFQDRVASSTAVTDDSWELIKSCIIYPEVSEADRIRKEFPGILGHLVERATELAGHRKSEVAPK